MNKKQFLAGLKEDGERNIFNRITASPLQVSNYRLLARGLAAREQWKAALHLLDLARKRFPGDRDLTHQAARTCEASGDWKRASALYQHLIQKGPDHPLAYEHLERILLKRGKRAQALRLWETVGAGSRLRMRALKRAAAILKEDGKLTPARGFLKLLLQEFGDDVQILKEVGRLYEREGRRKEAIKYFDRARELKPGDADTALLAGVCCRKAGRRKKARGIFNEILNFDPVNYGAHIHLTEMNIEDDQIEEAQCRLERLDARWPGNSRIKINRARLLDRQGELETAERICREGLSATPFYYTDELSLGHSVLGNILRKKGDEAAGAYFLLVGERSRDGGDFYQSMIGLINELLESERLDPAQRAIDGLLQRFPGNSLAFIKKARLHRKRGQWDEAVSCARQAEREENPRYFRDKVEALNLLSELYAERGMKKESLQSAQAAEICLSCRK